MHLAQVQHLGRPVILLKINVCCVIGTPGREQTFVPKPLKICRYAGSARTGDEQITAKLKIKSLQLRIALQRIGVIAQLNISRQRCYTLWSGAQINFHPVEKPLVVSFMAC